MSSDLLALDVGQSGSRARFICDGEVVAENDLAGILSDKPQVPQLAALVMQASALSERSATQVAIGSSGIDERVTAKALLELVGAAGVQRIALTHDSVAGYLGALAQNRGVVVAAGTGAVTLAVGTNSVARVDGWGNLIGDAGSGYWIGRAALEMVLRAHDGRGPETALTAMVQQDFPDLELSYLELQRDPRKVSRIASYAKIVSGLAGTDEVSRSILESAAGELATSAVTALRRVGELDQFSTLVASVGQVFKSKVLTGRFNTFVREQVPGAQIVKPLGTAVDGAAQLFDIDPEFPLANRIDIAE